MESLSPYSIQRPPFVFCRCCLLSSAIEPNLSRSVTAERSATAVFSDLKTPTRRPNTHILFGAWDDSDVVFGAVAAEVGSAGRRLRRQVRCAVRTCVDVVPIIVESSGKEVRNMGTAARSKERGALTA